MLAEIVSGAQSTLARQGPEEVEQDICGGAGIGSGEDGSEQSIVEADPKAPGWTKRLQVGSAPPERPPCPGRIGASEQSIRGFAENLSEDAIN